jgi:H-type lectin domain
LVIGIAVVVMAMVVIVLTITVATILSVTAFFTRVPFEFFGFKVWQSGLTYETRIFDLEDIPKNFYDGSVGVRSIPKHVESTQRFTEQPRVMISITKIDAGDGIARSHVTAENITRKGFDIRFKTWEDSKLYSVSASWVAMGR